MTSKIVFAAGASKIKFNCLETWLGLDDLIQVMPKRHQLALRQIVIKYLRF